MAKGFILLKSSSPDLHNVNRFLSHLSSNGLYYKKPEDNLVYVFDENSDYENYTLEDVEFLSRLFSFDTYSSINFHVWCSTGSSISSTIKMSKDKLMFEGWIDTVSHRDVCRVVECFFNIDTSGMLFDYSIIDTINRYEFYDWELALNEHEPPIVSHCDFIVIKEVLADNISFVISYLEKIKVGGYDYFVWSHSIDGCLIPTKTVKNLLIE